MKKYINLILIPLLASVVIIQIFSDRNKAKAVFNEPIIFRSNLISIIDIGLHNAASDLLWLGSIQYFGGTGSRTMEKMPDYLFTATELDPKFSYPYAFGALILPSIKQQDKALELGQKGVDLNLDDWRISYYMAMIYYLDKEDSLNAARYFDIAGHTPSAPPNAKNVAAKFGMNSSKRAQTIQIWQSIYDTTRDEIVKKRAENYLIQFQTLDILDQAIQIYQKKYKKLPVDINELVIANIIDRVPVDPFGFKYIIENGKATLE